MTSAHLNQTPGFNSFTALAGLDQAALDALPEAVYLCAGDGRVVRFNNRAAELWGRTPVAGSPDERFCGSFRLYRTDGALLPHDQCPMAAALKTGASFHNQEVVVEQPTGQRLTVRVNIAPLMDEDGRVSGAINCFQDITEHKRAQEAIRATAAELSDEITALTKLAEASGRLWQARTLHEGLDEMLAASIALLGADKGNIQLVDDPKRVLTIAAQHGFGPDFLEVFREVSAEDDSACGRALRTGERIVIEDVECDVAYAPLREVARAAGYRAVQSTPLLKRNGVPLGMISTHWSSVHRPSAQDLRRLDLYARQASDFIERCHIEDVLRQQREEAEIQIDVARSLAGELDLEKLLQRVTDAATKLARAKFGAFFYNATDDRGEAYLLYSLSGAPREAFERFGAPRNTALFEPTFRGRGATRIADVLTDVRYGKSPPHHGMPKGHLPVRSYLAVPVISRAGDVLGGLFLGHPEPGVFTERAERLVVGVAAQAAVAIDNARLFQERAKAEAALRDNERRLREMIDALPAAIYTTDAEGRITYFNPAAVEFSGRVPKIGTDEWCVSWKLYSADGTAMPHDQCPMAIALKEGRIVRGVEAIAERPDGTRAWFMPYPTPLHDEAGKIVGAINMLVDITERKKAEEILRESEERFRALSDSAPALIWVNDVDGCVYVNRSYLDFLGVRIDDVRGYDWSQFIHPDDRTAYVDNYIQAMAERRQFEADFRFRRNDGEYRWMRTVGQPRLTATGELKGYAGVTIDITERRQAEEVQRMLTAELSHRVKNMLATVQAVATQTLRNNANPAEFVTSFGGRIQSMSRVHALLSSSNWQAADLREIIRDQLLSGPVDETRVTAWGPSVGLEPQIATQMAMMLHELGTNSIKYGALSKPEGVVTIGWTVSNDMLHLNWTERGGPPVKAPTRRGFGTTLIEQTARSTGGSAEMSMEGEGVRWRITIPLSSARTSADDVQSSQFIDTAPRRNSDRHANATPSILAGKRFLIVEDEPLVALDMGSTLEQVGAQIVGSVGNVSEALALFERSNPDAVLLDGNLAGQAVDSIAAALTRRNVPFAFVTGYGRDSLPTAFASAEMLSKPFSSEQLIGTASRLVRKPAEVRKLRE